MNGSPRTPADPVPVVIVGAGPVGVTAATLLGQYGLVLAGEPVGEVHPHATLAVLRDVGDLDVATQADRRLVLEVGAQ